MRAMVVLVVLALISGVAEDAAARNQTSLGNLRISAARVPDWYAISRIDTSSWKRYDVTKSTDMSPLGCATASPADGASDEAAIQCAIDKAAERSIIYLPPGTYNFADRDILEMRNRRVVAGAGPGQTTIKHVRDGKSLTDSCRGSSFTNFLGTVGSSTSWTSGYTRGTTVIGVGNGTLFKADDYIQLHMNDDSSKLDNPPNTDPKWEPIFRVAAVSGNNVTLDRPLRLDYTAVTTGRTAKKLNPVRGAALRDLTMRNVDVDGGTKQVCIRNAVENEVSNVEFTGYYEKSMDVTNAARNIITGNFFHHPVDPETGNNYTLELVDNATDNLVHNNVFSDLWNAVTVMNGAAGNVISYNYMTRCNDRRAVFFHGGYPSENLVEGNVTDCNMDIDNYWGRQGIRNTFYRNRFTDNGLDQKVVSTIRSHRDTASRPIADHVNILLNHSGAYYGVTGCEYFSGTCFPLDDNYGADMTNLWFERNVARDTRSTSQCTGDSQPWACCTAEGKGGCGFGSLVGELPSTDCGTGNGSGDCFSSANTNVEGAGPPSSWSTLSFPHSLVAGWNAASARPPGWCQETPWPAVGADVDRWSSALIPIPAERRARGLTCTAVGGTVVNPPPPTPQLDPPQMQ